MLIDMNNTISSLDAIGKKPDDASLLHLLEHKFGSEVQREWALYCGRQTAALRRDKRIALEKKNAEAKQGDMVLVPAQIRAQAAAVMWAPTATDFLEHVQCTLDSIDSFGGDTLPLQASSSQPKGDKKQGAKRKAERLSDQGPRKERFSTAMALPVQDQGGQGYRQGSQGYQQGGQGRYQQGGQGRYQGGQGRGGGGGAAGGAQRGGGAQNAPQKKKPPPKKQPTEAAGVEEERTCLICGPDSHPSRMCRDFKAMDVKKRWSLAEKKGCIICLLPGHKPPQCGEGRQYCCWCNQGPFPMDLSPITERSGSPASTTDLNSS